MKVLAKLVPFVLVLSLLGTATATGKTEYHRAAAWNKATMMHYRQMTARANGSPSPRWPTSHCKGECQHLLDQYASQRLHAEKAWDQIRFGTDRTAVKKIIRYWFSKQGKLVLSHAFTVAGCENNFVAANGPSPTGDWGAWQINYAAHGREFGDGSFTAFKQATEDPWSATQIAYRWSSHGTNFSPTWTCGTIHGID